MICIMSVSEKQQNILKIREFLVFSQKFKICKFGKLIAGFEKFLLKAKHSKTMLFKVKVHVDKHMLHLTGLASFINKSQIRLVFQVLFSYFSIF